MKLILASQSKNRQELLKLSKIPFTAKPANIEESEIQAKDPQKRAIKVARAKAGKIAITENNCVILAADTFALYRNKVVEKPKFKMDALEILKSFSGTSHLMITGWYVTNTNTKAVYQGASETRVFFRQLSDKVLTNFVNDHPVIQWAAGYSPYNTAAFSFIEKIEGSLTGFTHGLPLEQIMPILLKEQVI